MPMDHFYTGTVIISVRLPAEKGHVLLDNPVGVLTNEPQLEQQYTQLQRYAIPSHAIRLCALLTTKLCSSPD